MSSFTSFTCYDAADQAGKSRLWGGIHLSPADLVGGKTGRLAGKSTVLLAMKYLDGSAVP